MGSFDTLLALASSEPEAFEQVLGAPPDQAIITELTTTKGKPRAIRGWALRLLAAAHDSQPVERHAAVCEDIGRWVAAVARGARLPESKLDPILRDVWRLGVDARLYWARASALVPLRALVGRKGQPAEQDRAIYEAILRFRRYDVLAEWARDGASTGEKQTKKAGHPSDDVAVRARRYDGVRAMATSGNDLLVAWYREGFDVLTLGSSVAAGRHLWELQRIGGEPAADAASTVGWADAGTHVRGLRESPTLRVDGTRSKSVLSARSILAGTDGVYVGCVVKGGAAGVAVLRKKPSGGWKAEPAVAIEDHGRAGARLANPVLALAADGKNLYAGCEDGRVLVAPISEVGGKKSWKEVARVAGAVRSLACAAGGRPTRLLVGTATGFIGAYEEIERERYEDIVSGKTVKSTELRWLPVWATAEGDDAIVAVGSFSHHVVFAVSESGMVVLFDNETCPGARLDRIRLPWVTFAALPIQPGELGVRHCGDPHAPVGVLALGCDRGRVRVVSLHHPRRKPDGTADVWRGPTPPGILSPQREAMAVAAPLSEWWGLGKGELPAVTGAEAVDLAAIDQKRLRSYLSALRRSHRRARTHREVCARVLTSIAPGDGANVADIVKALEASTKQRTPGTHRALLLELVTLFRSLVRAVQEASDTGEAQLASRAATMMAYLLGRRDELVTLEVFRAMNLLLLRNSGHDLWDSLVKPFVQSLAEHGAGAAPLGNAAGAALRFETARGAALALLRLPDQALVIAATLCRGGHDVEFADRADDAIVVLKKVHSRDVPPCARVQFGKLSRPQENDATAGYENRLKGGNPDAVVQDWTPVGKVLDALVLLAGALESQAGGVAAAARAAGKAIPATKSTPSGSGAPAWFPRSRELLVSEDTFPVIKPPASDPDVLDVATVRWSRVQLLPWCKGRLGRLGELRRARSLAPAYADLYHGILTRLRDAAEAFPTSATVHNTLLDGALSHDLIEALDEHAFRLYGIQRLHHPVGCPLPLREVVEQLRTAVGERRFALELAAAALRAVAIPNTMRELQALLRARGLSPGSGAIEEGHVNRYLAEGKGAKDDVKIDAEVTGALGLLGKDDTASWRKLHVLGVICAQLRRNRDEHASGDGLWNVKDKVITCTFPTKSKRRGDWAQQLCRLPVPRNPDPGVRSNGLGLYICGLAAAQVGWRLSAALADASFTVTLDVTEVKGA